MTDLPFSDPGDPLVQAPHPLISGDQIAAAGMQTARAVAGLGQALQPLANATAEAEGRQAALNPIVTRDAQGKVQAIQPRQSFIFNAEAGAAYERSAVSGTLAQAQAIPTMDLNNIRQKFDGDPQGFLNAANAYRQEQAKVYGASPLGVAMIDNIATMTAQHYNGLLNAKLTQDDNNNQASVKAQISSTLNDMSQLARQGATDTPAYKQAQEKLGGYYDQLEANPQWGTPKAVVDNMRTSAANQLQGEVIVGHMDRTYAGQGVIAARKELYDAADGLSGASDAQRATIKAAGEARLSYLQGQNQAAIQANSDNLNTLSTMLGKGQHVDDSVWEKAQQAAVAAGDGTSAQRVAAMRAQYDLDMAKHGAGPSQQAAVLMKGVPTGGATEAAAMQYFQSQGWSQAQAAGIVGNLVHESRLNTGANNPGDGSDGSDSIGIGQWNGSRAQALRAFAAAQGKPVTDFGTQLAFVQHELQTTEGSAAMALRAAGNIHDATGAFAINYERASGSESGVAENVIHWQDRINNAVRLAGGGASTVAVAPSANGVPYTDAQVKQNPFLLSQYIQAQARDAGQSQQAATLIGTAAEKQLQNGFMPAPQVLANYMQLTEGATDTGTVAQRERLTSMVQGKIASDVAMGMPAAQGQAYLNSVMQQAQGGSIHQQNIAYEAQAAYQRGQKQLNDEPAAAAMNRGWIAQQPRPLNFDDPHDLGAAMLERAQVMQSIAAREGRGWLNRSVLSGDDESAMSSVFKMGTAQQQANMVSAIVNSGMPQTQAQATLGAIGSTGASGQAMAKAAAITPYDQRVAATIIDGQSRLDGKEASGLVPKAEEWEDKINSKLPINDFPNATDLEATKNAIKAYYASTSASSNDLGKSVNDKRLQDAVDAVTGGLVRQSNGSMIYPPDYRVPETVTKDIIRGLTQDDIKGATIDGQPFEARLLSSPAWASGGQYRLQSRGPDGTYYIVTGSGQDAKAVMGPDGNKFVLNLRDKVPAAQARAQALGLDAGAAFVSGVSPRNGIDYQSALAGSGGGY